MNFLKKAFKSLGRVVKSGVSKVGALAASFATNPLGALGVVGSKAIGALGSIKRAGEKVAVKAKAQLLGASVQARKEASLPWWLLPVALVAGFFLIGGGGRNVFR